MSRIGKAPIILPDQTSALVEENTITVKGPKGSLRMSLQGAKINIQNNSISVSFLDQETYKKLWGTIRSLINNMVIGVSKGFTKELNIVGTGYRAEKKDTYLSMFLGKTHEICVECPNDIFISVPKQTSVMLESISKQSLGDFANKIFSLRPPEPYKGKGVRYADKPVRKKEKASKK